MLKDQNQRVEDCETERTGERKRRRREREGGTQRRERKEKQETKVLLQYQSGTRYAV